MYSQLFLYTDYSQEVKEVERDEQGETFRISRWKGARIDQDVTVCLPAAA
jgi:hypothetical protein